VLASTSSQLRCARLTQPKLLALTPSSANGTEMSLTAHTLTLQLQPGHVECRTDTLNIHTGTPPPAITLAQLLQARSTMYALITLPSVKMLQLSTIAHLLLIQALVCKTDALGTIQNHSSPRSSATQLKFLTTLVLKNGSNASPKISMNANPVLLQLLLKAANGPMELVYTVTKDSALSNP